MRTRRIGRGSWNRPNRPDSRLRPELLAPTYGCGPNCKHGLRIEAYLLARKVDTKACNMQSDGCTVPRPFLDAVLLYTMQCHFYVVLNSELRLLQSTAIPLELSNAIYLAWRRYVRLLLKGSTVRFFVLCRYLRIHLFLRRL